MKRCVEPLSVSFGKHMAEKGVYVLMIFVPSERWIEVGKLGVHKFPGGYYAYTGSALGSGAASLEGRISRHLRKEKRKRWHIDFLLADEDVRAVSALIIPTEKRLECEVNMYLRKAVNARILVPNFGSSDCSEACVSHLLYLGDDRNIVDRITGLFREKTGEVVLLEFV
ncbi:MAG: DUF123 domain-containing protein [Candidatus Bathyarchaeia archaeon]